MLLREQLGGRRHLAGSFMFNQVRRYVLSKSGQSYQCSYAIKGNSSEYCGSSVAMDVSITAGYQTAEPTGAEAGFQGCFSDPATLQQIYFVSSLNSQNLCAENCAMKGYNLSGVTQGST